MPEPVDDVIAAPIPVADCALLQDSLALVADLRRQLAEERLAAEQEVARMKEVVEKYEVDMADLSQSNY